MSGAFPATIARLAFAALVVASVVVTPSSAATLVAKVDLSAQRMKVLVDGQEKFTWVVSTGRDGWRTKPGVYTPFSMREKFYSTKWKMSLPFLVWIGEDGTAIHGTDYSSKLGRPASHGCIRLSIPNAAKFYALVNQHGMWNTQVVVLP